MAKGADINKGHVFEYTALSKAIELNDELAIERLLRLGANINKVIEGKTRLLEAISQGNESRVRKLVDLGADVNQVNNHRDSPLCVATRIFDQFGRNLAAKNIIKILLENGAEISYKLTSSDVKLLDNIIAELNVENTKIKQAATSLVHETGRRNLSIFEAMVKPNIMEPASVTYARQRWLRNPQEVTFVQWHTDLEKEGNFFGLNIIAQRVQAALFGHEHFVDDNIDATEE